jgi:hypothetical protein
MRIMAYSEWFEDVPVVGKLPTSAAVSKLREIGEDETVSELETQKDQPQPALGLNLPFLDRPWLHTAHTFGFIPAGPSKPSVDIQHASEIQPDESLRHSRIRITLGALRVASYPGLGAHHILFDFYGQNQVPKRVEHAHFSCKHRARDGERAAVLGFPIFVGLNVGAGGVAFKCYTVNVKNDEDEKFLGFLDSDVFRQGLELATTAQPAVALLSETALGVTKAIARRNRNIPVQEFALGLDFSSAPLGARLAEGSYIAVQIPEMLETVWDWSTWVYHTSVGNVVSRGDPSKLIPYNYIAFNVSRM